MVELSDALTILATSSVAKDREAITRLEKVTKEDILVTIGRLENSEAMVENAQADLIEQSQRLARVALLSTGLMCGGLCCLVTIWLRPSLAIAVAPVGFVVGAAAQSMVLVNNERRLKSLQVALSRCSSIQ